MTQSLTNANRLTGSSPGSARAAGDADANVPGSGDPTEKAAVQGAGANRTPANAINAPAASTRTPSATLDIILNARAGTGSDPASIRAAFGKHGIAVRFHGGDGAQDLDAQIDAACAHASGCVVAAGGDGTLNGVATRLAGTQVAMGILPLGTLNHFARDLGIPMALDGAVAVIARGHRRAVDVGEVNGRVFLNNASLGLYATMVAHREHIQRRLSLSKWPAMARAAWATLRHPHSFEASVDVDGAARRWCTPFLFVGNNPYTVQGPALGQRPRLDTGQLSLYVLHPKSRPALLWFVLRALAGKLSRPKDLDALQATQLCVQGQDAPVRVAFDGELDELAMPLHFRSRPRALQVLVPAPDDGGAR